MSRGTAGFETDRLHEKCAVAAVVSSSNEFRASEQAAEILFATQHRGDEASGLATLMADGELRSKRAPGLVSKIYTEEDMENLDGELLIGHNRYSTSGDKSKHLQPCIDTPLGFSFAHNGNLPDTQKLEEYLAKHNIRTRHFNDSEMMSLALAQHIRKGRSLPDAIEKVSPLFTGAYSCVAMHEDMVVAFRDPHGIRPLEFGRINGHGYAVSSETCGLDIIDAYDLDSVQPGEMVIMNNDGHERRQFAEATPRLDMFEFVYFARHDSSLNGVSVNKVRRNFGKELAKLHPPQIGNHKSISVVGVPDTSVPAAVGYAKHHGLSIDPDSIIKNRYIGRTFMQPKQGERVRQLRRKHNFIPELVEGKDLILIDDSIVRGNTMPRMVQLARKLGAKSVTVLIASAPVRFPDYYGIDTPKQSELMAANLTMKEMRREIGCDYLGFLTVSSMICATGLPEDGFNLSAFTGDYPIDIGRRSQEVFEPKSRKYIK